MHLIFVPGPGESFFSWSVSAGNSSTVRINMIPDTHAWIADTELVNSTNLHCPIGLLHAWHHQLKLGCVVREGYLWHEVDSDLQSHISDASKQCLRGCD